MRPELRDLLNQAAGEPRSGIDIERIERIARRTSFNRRAMMGVGGLVAVSLAWVTIGSVSLPRRERPAPEAVSFAPSTVELPPSLLGPLAPGTYVAEAFKPKFSFQIDSPGWSAKLLSPNRVTLVSRRLHLDVMLWDKVYSERHSGSLAARSVPDDLLAWLESHLRLGSVDIPAITIGGVAAQGLELSVVSPMPRSTVGCSTGRCVPLARIKGARERFTISAGHRTAFYVLPAGEEEIVLVISAPPRVFSEVVGEARALMRTLDFASFGS